MASHSLNPDPVIAQVKRLILTQLKVVLRSFNLPVSGPKATLQQRIINLIQQRASVNDVDGFNRLRHIVSHPDQDALNHFTSPAPAARAFQADHRQQASPYQPHPPAGPPGPIMPAPNGNAMNRTLIFKPSPFYSIITSLSPVVELSVREHTRDTAAATINLGNDAVNRLVQDPNTRVMLFCAAESMHSPFQRVDIAFPYQVEIKVNQDEVKANLRGLKNKPGSTRPADITPFLRKRAGYDNHLQVTYALTTKKFFLIVNLVRQQPVSEIVSKLKTSNRKIAKDRVIRETKSRAEDSDIQISSTILSLKCPVSTLRIQDPCRSSICTHNQCFDATSFLQLQEQAPTWTCPICNQVVSFDNLQIDMYVDEILKSTPRSLDQVMVEPDGTWRRIADDSQSPGMNGGQQKSSDDDDDDDDLIELNEGPQTSFIKRENPSEIPLLRTPPTSSREQSTHSALLAPPTSSNKRPASQVVDLTLSSDDDEDPVRGPNKRQAIHNPLDPASAFISRPSSIPLRPNGVDYDPNRSQPYQSNSLPSPNYESRSYGKPP